MNQNRPLMTKSVVMWITSGSAEVIQRLVVNAGSAAFSTSLAFPQNNGLLMQKEKERQCSPAPFFLPLCPRQEDKAMIRYFAAVCKAILLHSEENLFIAVNRSFNALKEPCPSCGAKTKLTPHGSYKRHLVSWNGSEVVDARITVNRYRCCSCGKTHAILPALLVPYGSYSLHFILTVITAYFERKSSVADLCAQFGIAVSSLYAWKQRLLDHYGLLCALLSEANRLTAALARELLSDARLIDHIRMFFRFYGFSFMQRSKKTTHSNST